jgi:hypothetical protein|nr:MAG TPA: hypothetical protein [Bacteriophage sp.]
MKHFLLTFLTYLKKIVDKLYYKKYKQYNQETLVRTMFPSLVTLDNYTKLNSYLMSRSIIEIDELVNAILSYYWSEVALYHGRKDYESVSKLQ